MFEVSLADLQSDQDAERSFRKFRLIAEDVQGRNVLTNFHGMDLTTDKLRSMVKKWQTLIEANVDVKTTDGYLLRVFCIGFTNKDQLSTRKTCYAQHAQVCSWSILCIHLTRNFVEHFNRFMIGWLKILRILTHSLTTLFMLKWIVILNVLHEQLQYIVFIHKFNKQFITKIYKNSYSMDFFLMLRNFWIYIFIWLKSVKTLKFWIKYVLITFV